MKHRSLVVLLALSSAVTPVVACSDSPEATKTTTTTRPGNADVYVRIEAEADCSKLQQMFDQAYENHERDNAGGRTEQMRWSTGYMDAADERMKKLGCYDKS